jgi:hypothetical protein
VPGRAGAQGLCGGFPRRNAPRPSDRVSHYRIMVDMRDTRGMTQYAHARALHLLEDTGLDADDARYVMKRLYDLGFGYVGTRDTGPGASPPGQHPRKAARAQTRAALIDQMKAETAQARAELAAQRDAAIEAERAQEAEEKAALERQLAVQAVLAGLPG